jgi:hypothetical protein
MKSRKLLIPLVFTLLVAILYLAALVPYARADPPFVYTDDLNDDTDDYFESPGETVRIKSYAGFAPYEIRIFKSDPDQSYPGPYTGPWTYVTTITVTTTGWVDSDFIYNEEPKTWWKAQIYKDGVPYEYATYFVIPQVPLGVATILTACFAGLGLNKLRWARKEKE